MSIRTKENKSKNYYLNILLKIKHKPIIIEYIFSFLTNNPFIFFKLLEKDELLKNEINSFFNKKKKNNNLSDTLNSNINYILTFNKFMKKFNLNNININSLLEEKNSEILSDPSVTTFYSKKFWEEMNQNNKEYKNYIPLSLSYIEKMIYNLFEHLNSIKLFYLPKKNIKSKIEYNDNIYIENYLIKKNINQEIDILYCIIDDNEFYKYINRFKNNIKIKKLYLIYIKGNINIDIYEAIKKYLNSFNNEYLEEIIFGDGFLRDESIYIYK